MFPVTLRLAARIVLLSSFYLLAVARVFSVDSELGSRLNAEFFA
jgi:hypothetical protein